MFFKILCIFAQCVLLSFAAESNQPSTPKQNLTVEIFYENLCPDSVKFFSENFYNYYATSNISEGIDFKLNTYGNSNTTTTSLGNYSFTCEHGPNECYSNLIHACILNNSQINISSVLNFVNCSLRDAFYNPSNQSTLEIFSLCAKRANIDETSIKLCVNNHMANQSLYEMGIKKNQYKIEKIPSVVFNNVYNKTISENAVNNFPEALCNFVKMNNLSNEYCKAKPNSASIATVSLLPVVIATFLLAKMYQ